MRQRLARIRASIEKLPSGQRVFRGVLRQFEVRDLEAIREEDLGKAIANCEEVYRVPLPSSTNGCGVQA